MRRFDFNKSVRFNVPLKGYTTYRIGGASDSLIEVFDTESLIETVSRGGEMLILGRGSNVLVSDKGFRGLSVIIKSNAVKTAGTEIYAEAGASLSLVAQHAVEAGLAGLEFAVGIPGSIGGACIMNAGAFGACVGDVISRVEVLRDNKVITLSGGECGFSYRSSGFNKGDIMLAAVFSLKNGDKAELLALKKQYALFRKNTQPQGYCAGSVFKKADKPAGYYIDRAGFKGFRSGGAVVSDLHANFIMNTGHATASDVAGIIDTVKAGVRIKFGVSLKEEIKYIGF